MGPVPKASVDFLAGIGAGFAEALNLSVQSCALKLCRESDLKTGHLDVF